MGEGGMEERKRGLEEQQYEGGIKGQNAVGKTIEER